MMDERAASVDAALSVIPTPSYYRKISQLMK